jgi:hypothetical protein
MDGTGKHHLREISQAHNVKRLHAFSHMWNIDYKHNNIMKNWSCYGKVTYESGRVKEGN